MKTQCQRQGFKVTVDVAESLIAEQGHDPEAVREALHDAAREMRRAVAVAMRGAAGLLILPELVSMTADEIAKKWNRGQHGEGAKPDPLHVYVRAVPPSRAKPKPARALPVAPDAEGKPDRALGEGMIADVLAGWVSEILQGGTATLTRPDGSRVQVRAVNGMPAVTRQSPGNA